MSILIWLGETITGSAIKGIWTRFFPSKDEQLGALKQEAKDNEMVIDAVKERQEVNQSVDAMSDNAAVIELSKWRKS